MRYLGIVQLCKMPGESRISLDRRSLCQLSWNANSSCRQCRLTLGWCRINVYQTGPSKHRYQWLVGSIAGHVPANTYQHVKIPEFLLAPDSRRHSFVWRGPEEHRPVDRWMGWLLLSFHQCCLRRQEWFHIDNAAFAMSWDGLQLQWLHLGLE